MIVDTLKDRYSLPAILESVSLSKSSYYYQEMVRKRKDKYNDIRKIINGLFHGNKECYGYRRIYGLLKREGIILSEKVVRRIMREEGLAVKTKRRRKYSSYHGEISPSVPNVLQRDFSADKPNKKWLTDITEFAIPEGKVYLSPILDSFDGMLPCWTIGTSPNAALVEGMLDQAISGLRKDEHAGLERSMSKKGYSPDNATCEGLFGQLKNELFYNRDWTGVNIHEFIDILNEYLVWYNEKRIKTSLENMSPREYRRSLGLAV